MKLLGFLGKRVKSQGLPRDLSLYADFFSAQASSPSIVQRNELNRAVVDELFEMEHLQLTEAFRIIDKNGDGKISKQELGVMWSMLGEKVTEKELRFMVQEADSNGDGEIDLREFVILTLGFDDNSKQAEEIRLAFSVADADRNGHI